jgi:hypothetical protein
MSEEADMLSRPKLPRTLDRRTSENAPTKLSEKLGRAHSIAYGPSKGPENGPFRAPYIRQTHTWSIARTPFQTVSF